jgi:hypothetical protein
MSATAIFEEPASSLLPSSARRVLIGRIGLVVTVVPTVISLLRGPNGTQVPNIILLTISFIGFGAVVWAGRRRDGLDRRLVIVVTGGLMILAVALPPIQSRDVWSYTMYGRMVSHYHDSPFTHVPADYPADPLAVRVAPVWAHTPSVYGPIWVAMSVPGTSLAGSSPLLNRLYFEALAALSVALAMWIIDRSTNHSPLALALVGVNPFIVLSVVNGAHNDATVGLCVLGAVLLALKNRWAACSALLALAVGIKVAAALCIIGVVVWAWRWRGWRTALRVLAWSGGLVLLIYAVGGGMDAVRPLQKASSQISGGSIWNWARLVAFAVFGHSASVGRRISSVATLATVTLAALLVIRHRSKTHPAVVVGLAVLAYGLVAAYTLPWYLAWGLLPLALCYRSRTTVAMLVLAAVLNIANVPDPRSAGNILRFRLEGAGAAFQGVYTRSIVPAIELLLIIGAVVWSMTDIRGWLARRYPGPIGRFVSSDAPRPDAEPIETPTS